MNYSCLCVFSIKTININKNKNNKDKPKFTKGGYLSYSAYKAEIGNILDIMSIEENSQIKNRLVQNIQINVLDKLQEKNLYSVLLWIDYVDSGISKGSTPMKAIIIKKGMSAELLLEKFKFITIKFSIIQFLWKISSGSCTNRCYCFSSIFSLTSKLKQWHF